MVVDRNIVCPVLIGRTAHVASLDEALKHAVAGEGATVLVAGEAGVGKSRLLRAATIAAREKGLLVLQGTSFETDRALPFAPLLDLVRSLAARTSPAAAAHALAPAAPELLALFPELSSVFTEVHAAPPTDPEHGRRRLLHAILAALDRLSRIQPLLLVFEDVHWSDDATLDLLLFLAQGVAERPVVLALSYRSDEVGPRLSRLLAEVDRRRVGIELRLSRLSQSEVEEMLLAIFGTAVVPDRHFAGMLHSLTEGNPFFVEEVLKALVVSGDFAPTEHGRWKARRLERVQVPRSAVEAVRRRLASLSVAAREIASMAAVAGRRLDFALLQALSGRDEEELIALVKELIDAQLAVDEPADRIAFRHALTREAIYAELLGRERTGLHRRVAAAIARLNPAETDTVVDMLAYHTFEAGDWPTARRYALRAAEHATALYAPHEALLHLNRAVVAAEREGVPAEDEILLARGRALETLGEFEAANRDFEVVVAASRREGRGDAEWSALHALGMLWAARAYDRAGAFRQAALGVARASGDPGRIARSLNRIGNWYLNLEQPGAARSYHDEALALLRSIGDDRGVAETIDLIAMSCHIAGDEPEAVEHYEDVVSRFEALGNRRGLAAARALLALCGPSHHCSAVGFGWSDQIPAVLDSLQPVNLTQEIGWRAGEAFCRMVLGDCLAWRGEYDRALSLARGALTIAEELNHLEWQAGASRVLGIIMHDLGASDTAIQHLERAHAAALELGSRTWTRWTAAPFAIVLAQGGEVSRAVAILDSAAVSPVVPREHADANANTSGGAAPTLGERQIDLARTELLLAVGDAAGALSLVEDLMRRESAAGSAAERSQRELGLPRHHLLRGRALQALGRDDEAATAFGDSRDAAAATHAPPLRWRASAALGHSYRRLRRRLEARAAFAEAGETSRSLLARIPDEDLRTSFLSAVASEVPPPNEPSPRQATKEARGGLTRREWQVAELVAAGKSNRAIARTLGISERTVEDHVANALARHGFSSRAQLAAWSVQLSGQTPPW